LIAYWVIDQENSKYMFQCPAETPTEEILDSRLEDMKRRLKVLSKGLLEASDVVPDSVDDRLFLFKVDFLHRTVKDYLQTPDAQSMLQSWSDDTFNFDWEICNAIGALAKMAPRESFTPSKPIWDYSFTFFLVHASRLDRNPLFRADIASLLEHLQETVEPAFEEHKDILYSSLAYDPDIIESRIPCLRGKCLESDLVILLACACLGVTNFVVEKFTKEPQLCNKVANHVTSLFWSMTRFIERTDPELLLEESGMVMLKLFLDHGADPNRDGHPNSHLNGHSEWRLILEDLGRLGDDAYRKRLNGFEAIKLLLRHGADFEQQCTSLSMAGENEDVKASDLLRKWFDADQFGVLEDIVKWRGSKPQKSQKISKKMRNLKLWISSKK
jgi:hypothetical protein